MSNTMIPDDRYSPNMDIEGSIPDAVKEVLEPLRYSVVWLHAKWTIFEQLFCRDQQRIDLMERRAASFFSVIHDSLQNDLIVGLCRLTDPAATGRPKNQHQNLTLLRLAETVATAEPGSCFASDVNAQAKELQRFCCPLREWRDKRLAHTDLPTAVTAQLLSNFPGSTFADGLARVRGLMNAVELHYLDSEESYDEGVAAMLKRRDGDVIVSSLAEAEKSEEDEKRRRRTKKHSSEESV